MLYHQRAAVQVPGAGRRFAPLHRRRLSGAQSAVRRGREQRGKGPGRQLPSCNTGCNPLACNTGRSKSGRNPGVTRLLTPAPTHPPPTHPPTHPPSRLSMWSPVFAHKQGRVPLMLSCFLCGPQHVQCAALNTLMSCLLPIRHRLGAMLSRGTVLQSCIVAACRHVFERALDRFRGAWIRWHALASTGGWIGLICIHGGTPKSIQMRVLHALGSADRSPTLAYR